MADKPATSLWLQRGIWGLQLALIGLIIFCVVRMIMLLMNPSSGWTMDQPRSASVSEQSLRVQNDYDFAFDPFHAPQSDGPIEPVEIEEAPETSLNLILKGLRAAGPESSAYIKTTSSDDRNYYIGEEIVSGVTLHAVYADHVLLSVNGKIERLTNDNEERLIRAPEAEKPARMTGREPAALGSSARNLDVEASRAVRPSERFHDVENMQVGNMGADNISIVRSGDTSKLPHTRISCTELFQSIEPTPVRENNQLKGFKIRSKTTEAVLKPFRLKNNDIVTHIGSQDLRSGSLDWLSVINECNESSAPTFTVIRGGRALTVKAK